MRANVNDPVKVALPLALPSELCDEICEWGIRLDRSGSWMLGAAWNLSRDWVGNLEPNPESGEAEYKGAPRERNWFVPAEVMLEIAHTAERLRIAPEDVVSLAWSFARPGP